VVLKWAPGTGQVPAALVLAGVVPLDGGAEVRVSAVATTGLPAARRAAARRWLAMRVRRDLPALATGAAPAS
ncbi:hypothetical protein ABT297_42945, partial [Dactylosporangium sp. NPDC000555]|uniref:hypothetical protein n=1 Tax=Dactylosporangium sp. NPDC000555 TaxID=3154260 RepID=UPI003319ED29